MSLSIVADFCGGSAAVRCHVWPPSSETNTTAAPNVSLPDVLLTALRFVTTQRRSSGPTIVRGSVTRLEVSGSLTLTHVGAPAIAAAGARAAMSTASRTTRRNMAHFY